MTLKANIYLSTILLLFAISACKTTTDYHQLPIESRLNMVNENDFKYNFKKQPVALNFVAADYDMRQQNLINRDFRKLLASHDSIAIIKAIKHGKNWQYHKSFNNKINPPQAIKIDNPILKNVNNIYISYLSRQNSAKHDNIELIVSAYDTVGRIVYNELIIMPKNWKYSLFRKKFSKFLAQQFPVEAILLELRGDKQAGLFSAGRTSSVIKGQEFGIYEIDSHNKLVLLQTINVESVMEDSSWFYLDSNNSDRVNVGNILRTIAE